MRWHYLAHPYHADGRTLLKVRTSDCHVVTRFREQVRSTALPEDPVLLRIYRAESPPEAGGCTRR